MWVGAQERVQLALGTGRENFLALIFQPLLDIAIARLASGLIYRLRLPHPFSPS